MSANDLPEVTVLVSSSYGLNVCVPVPNIQVVILTPNVMVSGLWEMIRP